MSRKLLAVLALIASPAMAQEDGAGPNIVIEVDGQTKGQIVIDLADHVAPKHVAQILALTQEGVSREDAYAAVQENAMKVWRGEGRFIDFLKADARVTLPHDQLEALFDLGYHTKNVDVVFKRVFGEG